MGVARGKDQSRLAADPPLDSLALDVQTLDGLTEIVVDLAAVARDEIPAGFRIPGVRPVNSS